MATRNPSTKTVETLKHEEAKRKNIPTAEYQSVLQKEEQGPIRVAYERAQSPTSIRNSSGAGRMSRTGATSSSMRRRSTSRRKSIPKS